MTAKVTTKGTGRVDGSHRIHSLDGLRGVACIIVLLLHTGLIIKPFGSTHLYHLLPGTPAVLVFYVLSGVVLSLVPFRRLSEGGDYDWYLYYPRRIVRLCIPLFVAIAIGVSTSYIAYKSGSQFWSPLAIDWSGGGRIRAILLQFDILFNVTDSAQNIYGASMSRVDNPIWSMSWEMWFSLCLPLVVYVIVHIRSLLLVFFVATLAISLSYWSGYFPLRLCVMFLFGVAISRNFAFISKIKMPIVVETLCLIICIVGIEVWVVVPADRLLSTFAHTLMSLSCAGLVVIAISDGYLRKLLSTGPCMWLGKLSYSLYLTHIILISGCADFLPALGISSSWVQIAISLVGCFAYAWLFWYFVERPSIALSHKVKR